MKKINIALLIFIICVFLILFLVWNFIQSEGFAKNVSYRITQLVESRYDVKIGFEKLDFKFFPPGIEINGFTVSKNKFFKEKKFNSFSSEKVGIYFNVIDFFANKLSIKEIVVENGKAFLEIPKSLIEKNKSNVKKRKKVDVKKLIRSTLKDVPSFPEVMEFVGEGMPILVRSIVFRNVIINNNDSDLIKFDSSVGLTRKYFDIIFDGKNISKDYQKIMGGVDQLRFWVRLRENKYEVKRLRLNKKLDYVRFSGELTGDIKDLSNIKVVGKLNGKMDVVGLKDYVEVESVSDSIKEGHLYAESSVSGRLGNIDFDLELRSKKIKTDIFRLDEFYCHVKKINNNLVIKKLQGRKNDESVELLNSLVLYSFEKKKIIPNKAKLMAKSLNTRTVLEFLDDTMTPLDAVYDGNVDLVWDDNKILVEFLKGSKLKKLNVWNMDSGQNILNIKNATFNYSNVEVDFNSSEVKLKMHFTVGKSTLDFVGVVKENGIFFESKKKFVRFVDIGPIVGLDLAGEGQLKVILDDSSGKTILKFALDMSQLGLFGVSLGETRGKIDYIFEDNKLLLRDISSVTLDTNSVIDGKVLFGENSKILLKGNITKGSISDLPFVFKDIFSSYKGHIKNIIGNYQCNFSIEGPLLENQISISGKLKSESIRVGEEDFRSIFLNFKHLNNILEISNIDLKKQKGGIAGEIRYNLFKNIFSYNFNLRGLELREINYYKRTGLDLNGKLDGSFKGIGSSGEWDGELILQLKDSHINNFKVRNSQIKFSIDNNIVKTYMELIGRQIVLDSKLNLGNGKGNNSFVKVVVDVQDLREVIGVISDHNILVSNVSGRLKGSSEVFFNTKKVENLDAKVLIEKLNFHRSDVKMSLKNKGEIEINKGALKKWKIEVLGTSSKITSYGRGDLNSEYDIALNTILDGSLAELLSREIKNSEGMFKGEVRLRGNRNFSSYNIVGEGSNFKVLINKMPGGFEDLNFSVGLEKDSLYLNRCNGLFAGGAFDAKGVIVLKQLWPKIDFDLSFLNSALKLTSKGNLISSGQLKISGDKVPYLIKGKINVDGGVIRDEINDFRKNESYSFNQFDEFIPQVGRVVEKNLFDLEIDIKTKKSFSVKNSMAEIPFTGYLGLRGNLNQPIYKGELKVPAGKGKFLFKNQSFIINKGLVSFAGEDPGFLPKYQFVSVGKIENYNINFELVGEDDQYDIILSTEPFLSQNDILSLLTLGYTADTSKELDESDRQSLNSLGVGNLILERLKIGQGIRSNLGVNLSISPELVDSEESLLSGRSSRQSSNTSRYRTATKIKVQKQLNDDVNLSLSSIFGESEDQKQEMSVDYKLNRNMSVEGVYEFKNNNDEDEARNTDSVGADLKFRWTFK